MNISSESKVKFRQASNHCKRFLESTKLAHANKTKKSPSLFRNLALGTFGKLLIVFSDKYATLPLFINPKSCILLLIKQNHLLKTFPKSPILITWVSLCLFSLQELI